MKRIRALGSISGFARGAGCAPPNADLARSIWNGNKKSDYTISDEWKQGGGLRRKALQTGGMRSLPYYTANNHFGVSLPVQGEWRNGLNDRRG
jgi:hypothetical protein